MGAHTHCHPRSASLVSLAVVLLVGTSSLSGCVQADASKFVSLRWADVVGRDANCNGEVKNAPLPARSYDINGSGGVDWFVTLRCPGRKGGDQLEIFDGASNPDHPQHFDKVPL